MTERLGSVLHVPGRIVFLDDRSEATTFEQFAVLETVVGAHGTEWRLTDIRRGALWIMEPIGVTKGIVLIVPGGGYEFVSLRKEGLAAAEHLNALGYVVAILIYRLPGQLDYLSTVEDAERALDWIDGGSWSSVGVLGFSAGAHLALMTVSAICVVTEQRIDWLALIYPVFRLRNRYAHEGTAEHLAQGVELIRELLDGPGFIHPTLPPVFARHQLNDPVVSSMNTVELTSALSKAGVNHDAAIIAGYDHGFGFDGPILDALVTFLDKDRSQAETSAGFES